MNELEQIQTVHAPSWLYRIITALLKVPDL